MDTLEQERDELEAERDRLESDNRVLEDAVESLWEDFEWHVGAKTLVEVPEVARPVTPYEEVQDNSEKELEPLFSSAIETPEEVVSMKSSEPRGMAMLCGSSAKWRASNPGFCGMAIRSSPTREKTSVWR